MANQRKLFDQAEQLKALLRDCTPKRKKTVGTLRVLADELMEHHNNVCIAKVAGSSAAVAGFVFTAVGFGLSFVTFGTSLGIVAAGVGLVVGAAGGATNAGSSIAEACIQKGKFETAQKIIDDDRKAIKAFNDLLEGFRKAVEDSKIVNGIKAGIASFSVVKNLMGTSFKVGTRVAGTAASEGGEALFKGLSKVGKFAHIGGFVISAVLLPLDIYDLVTNSMKIDASRKGKKDEEPEAVKKLRELAYELEKDMPDENEFSRKLDDFISTAGMV